MRQFWKHILFIVLILAILSSCNNKDRTPNSLGEENIERNITEQDELQITAELDENLDLQLFNIIDEVNVNTSNTITSNNIEFKILPNGTMVDTRIPEENIEMILRRFEAIENGDLAGFRSSLPEAQDGVDFYYQLGLIFKYFEDFFGITADEFNEAVIDGTERLDVIARMLFHGQFPLKRRNTGLFIEKIELSDYAGIVVITKSGNEETVHEFVYW